MSIQQHLIVGLLAAVLTAGVGGAEKKTEDQKKKDASLLTVDRIFGSSEFEPQRFSARWLKNEAAYLTLENSKETPGGRDIVRYEAATGERRVVVPAARLVPPGETAPLKIDDYAFSEDRSLVLIFTNSKRVWRRNTRGDYWVLDRSSHELRKLGADAPPSTLMFAKFSPTGRYAAYVRDHNIYVEDLRDGGVTALTTSGSDTVINGTFDWAYEEEFGLRDGFRWSPDGTRIAYWRIDSQGVRQVPLVNNTAALYPRITEIPYPKVGQRNSACRVGVVEVRGGETTWLKVPGDPRDHYIARMDWPKDSSRIVLQQLNRLQNANHVMRADPKTGRVETMFVERDDAWVDIHDEMQWFSGGRRFTWISERDGWRHVYLMSRSGDSARLATPGPYDVIQLLTVDEKEGWLYFLASPDNPTRQALYRARLDGTDRQRLTPADQPGFHDYRISSDSRWAIHTVSSFDTPPVTELISLPDHKPIRTLAANERLRKKANQLKRRPGEFFRVDIGGGVLLDGWCIKPPDMNPRRKYPLLIYVYGEPAGRTVVDRWGGANYLWHLMLAQKGYVVMSFDNRGARAPRGRAWRKIVYRKIGVLAPKDQAAALQAVIRKRRYIDSRRIGIWGWSGGGSMSLNAIFKYPDLYGTAIAVAPVPNQRYYDTIYQERYMGLPGDNVDGFLEGSPINYAHQLKGNLLLIHGTGDDNCHYQGAEALIDELVRCNKPFTMMAYPNRTHAIREGRNTTLHLRSLMTRYLTEHLPPGPR